jgi:hypothetical protein
MDLLHVDIHEDVAMVIDLRAAAPEWGKQKEARKADQPRRAQPPMFWRSLRQLWHAPIGT